MPIYTPSEAFVSSSFLTAGTSFTTKQTTTRIKVELWGGGGAGGGGGSAAGNAAPSRGGGAGSYALKVFDVTPNTAYTYAIGIAGVAGGAGAIAGGNGGSTTFAVSGVTVTAPGGTGGAGTSASTTAESLPGGAGGAVATNGDVNGSGESGHTAVRFSGTVACASRGGSTIVGAGGNGRTTQGNGNAGTGNGSGGGGGCVINGGGNADGGAGTKGAILVTEYSDSRPTRFNGSNQQSLVLKSVTSYVAGTTHTTGTGTTLIEVELVGGGGGGGACDGIVSTVTCCSGGGAGGYGKKLFVVTPNTAYTFALGAAGAGGIAGNNPGTAGGDTTFTVGSVTVTAKGGGGGLGSLGAATTLVQRGGAGGVAGTGGDINAAGMPGEVCIRQGTVFVIGTCGGSTLWGKGGIAITAAAVGSAAIGNGAGGGGATSANATNRAGGAGTIGMVLVTEYELV